MKVRHHVNIQIQYVKILIEEACRIGRLDIKEISRPKTSDTKEGSRPERL